MELIYVTSDYIIWEITANNKNVGQMLSVYFSVLNGLLNVFKAQKGDNVVFFWQYNKIL